VRALAVRQIRFKEAGSMRKMAVRKLMGAALLVAAVLAVAGCGGGSKSSAPAPPTVTVGATTTTPPATTPATTTTTTSSSGGPTSLKNCGSLTNFGQEFSKAISASAGSGVAGLGAEADAFKTFANKAPAEIRDQLLIIGDALTKYAEALKGVDFKAGQVPSADTLAKLQAASKSISAPDVAAAGQKISAYVQAHCHA
jgi:ABC-type glycerol-3-phosphate transport system substrate-binding protein